MFNPHKCLIDHFAAELQAIYAQSYGQTDPPYGGIAAWAAWLALENIANSDMLYHVDRSKQFVRERFGEQRIRDIDGEVVASYIEMTRYPVPSDPHYLDTHEYPGLVRAADFIGQLADPDYLRKAPALFYEFEQLGANEQYGYKTPGDLRQKFAHFYWKVVNPYVQEGLRYLRVTQDGRQWIANLNSHVFMVEHGIL